VSGRGISGWAARIAQALYDGRRTAIDRMAAECVDLGGHGIVGSALQVREIPGDSFSVAAVEFKVIGTAVRASGCPPLPRPFASDLSGSDFAKLLMVGWVPAGIALDISLGIRAARRLADDQFRPLGHWERRGAGLYQSDGPGAAGCTESAGTGGTRAGR